MGAAVVNARVFAAAVLGTVLAAATDAGGAETETPRVLVVFAEDPDTRAGRAALRDLLLVYLRDFVLDFGSTDGQADVVVRLAALGGGRWQASFRTPPGPVVEKTYATRTSRSLALELRNDLRLYLLQIRMPPPPAAGPAANPRVDVSAAMATPTPPLPWRLHTDAAAALALPLGQDPVTQLRLALGISRGRWEAALRFEAGWAADRARESVAATTDSWGVGARLGYAFAAESHRNVRLALVGEGLWMRARTRVRSGGDAFARAISDAPRVSLGGELRWRCWRGLDVFGGPFVSVWPQSSTVRVGGADVYRSGILEVVGVAGVRASWE